MDARLFLSALALSATACGAPAPSPAPAPPSVAPSVMPEGSPGAPLALGVPGPAVAVAEVPPAPSSPSPPTTGGVDRCEGLVGPCGGWIGCVTVRADATTPGRYVGVASETGHLYTENHDCFGGVCNEICTGGSLSGCRPGLTEVAGPIVCSATVAPMRAPFTCRMEAGRCTQGPDPDMIPAS